MWEEGGHFWCCIYLFKVFDGFKVESLFIQQLQIFIIQLISAHLILLSFLFHL